jgi:hypothetical protein
MSTSTGTRAHRRNLLVPSFESASLGCKLLGGAVDPKNPSIFQMDIHESRRFGEYFRIWPGAHDNQIEVLATESGVRQLVLRVKEARRRFTQQVRKNGGIQESEVEEQARAAGGRILAEYRDVWVLELWTPEEERRYLCGMDDVRLFIAQVQTGTTVAEAHESLKPRAVKDAELRWPGLVRRQGEWFFLPLAEQEQGGLTTRLDQDPKAIKLRRPVGPGRRPHVADEVVRVERRITGKRRTRRLETVYARGTVRHLDHRPLALDTWRRVIRNREVNATANDRLRLRWID